MRAARWSSAPRMRAALSLNESFHVEMGPGTGATASHTSFRCITKIILSPIPQRQIILGSQPLLKDGDFFCVRGCPTPLHATLVVVSMANRTRGTSGSGDQNGQYNKRRYCWLACSCLHLSTLAFRKSLLLLLSSPRKLGKPGRKDASDAPESCLFSDFSRRPDADGRMKRHPESAA